MIQLSRYRRRPHDEWLRRAKRNATKKTMYAEPSISLKLSPHLGSNLSSIGIMLAAISQPYHAYEWQCEQTYFISVCLSFTMLLPSRMIFALSIRWNRAWNNLITAWSSRFTDRNRKASPPAVVIGRMLISSVSNIEVPGYSLTTLSLGISVWRGSPRKLMAISWYTSQHVIIAIHLCDGTSAMTSWCEHEGTDFTSIKSFMATPWECKVLYIVYEESSEGAVIWADYFIVLLPS